MGNITVGLAGNPNVGKSTVFNALTGLHQHTGNWPGKTVGSASGVFSTENHTYTIVDIPGTYSLNAHSSEEEVARDYIKYGGADMIVIVCDATCLERNLCLALQIMRESENVILCINLMDEARKKHLTIDIEKLSEMLGVPVIGVSARNAGTLEPLKNTLDALTDGVISSKPNTFSENFVYEAEKIAKLVVKTDGNRKNRDRSIDRILTSKKFGYPAMLALLALVFWLTAVGANYPSQLLMRGMAVMKDGLWTVFAKAGINDAVTGLLVNGLFYVPAWVVSVMLPPMAIFFPLFTLLEDSGYLPRIAFNLDKPFCACRACGKQALTMCMGFGCTAVGVTGCRIIDSPRERLLAIITNSLVPCNGKLPAMATVASVFVTCSSGGNILTALALTLVILTGICMTFCATKILSDTVLKGEPTSFTIEMPPYRRPQIGVVIIRSILDRTVFVLTRAIKAAAPAGVILWLLANMHINGISILSHAATFLEPVGRILGLDGIIIAAFLFGLPANEIVLPIVLMGYMSEGVLAEIGSSTQVFSVLSANGWTWKTAVCFLMFSLFHWPCATTIQTIKKETGSLKWTAVSVAVPMMIGFVLCFLLNMLFRII